MRSVNNSVTSVEQENKIAKELPLAGTGEPEAHITVKEIIRIVIPQNLFQYVTLPVPSFSYDVERFVKRWKPLFPLFEEPSPLFYQYGIQLYIQL